MRVFYPCQGSGNCGHCLAQKCTHKTMMPPPSSRAYTLTSALCSKVVRSAKQMSQWRRFGIVPGGASIFVVSGSSVNERQGSNALVFGGQVVCVHCPASRHLALSEPRDAVMEDAVKCSWMGLCCTSIRSLSPVLTLYGAWSHPSFLPLHFACSASGGEGISISVFTLLIMVHNPYRADLAVLQNLQ